MFGKEPRLNPLESRKRLLVAESELNRAQLAREWVALTAGARTLTGRVKFFGSIASAAALLVAGLGAFRRGKRADVGVKPSWIQTVLKGAQVAGSLWLAFRRRSQ
jgi:hypothetical protein